MDCFLGTYLETFSSPTIHFTFLEFRLVRGDKGDPCPVGVERVCMSGCEWDSETGLGRVFRRSNGEEGDRVQWSLNLSPKDPVILLEELNYTSCRGGMRTRRSY